LETTKCQIYEENLRQSKFLAKKLFLHERETAALREQFIAVFTRLFLALWHHLGLTLAPSKLLEMLHGMAEEHRPVLDRYLASRI